MPATRSQGDGAGVTCKCGLSIVRIERYHVTVEWSGDDWTLGAYDNGTHFHLFCPDGHESKAWGRDLPAAIQAFIYPESPPDRREDR